ncbi:CheW-like domain-containing protein [Roseateles sp. YR242]|uniref:chemotaxis protein CheW n=1 Tax=Roseateles sp. YR242 TaxID=1855305 RepID=UPI0008CF7DFD|nr:chemotaxis protein CheW [Roseateles sp. YR242]SEK94497.1 CheW-like domain-containing protein [Roseateles sp. YR242]
MNTTTTDALQAQLASWREAFDQSFAEPRDKGDWGDVWNVLGIRIAGEPFALHLDDLAGLLPAMTPAPYPADAPALLGLIGHRGQVLPLYDLRALLGRGTAPASRWWAIVRAAPLALAFEGFDGQWRLPPEDRLQQDGSSTDSHSGWTVKCGDELRPLIALAPLVERLTASFAAHHDAAPMGLQQA